MLAPPLRSPPLYSHFVRRVKLRIASRLAFVSNNISWGIVYRVYILYIINQFAIYCTLYSILILITMGNQKIPPIERLGTRILAKHPCFRCKGRPATYSLDSKGDHAPLEPSATGCPLTYQASLAVHGGQDPYSKLPWHQHHRHPWLHGTDDDNDERLSLFSNPTNLYVKT